MKKLINKFERGGRKFEVVDTNGQLLCCAVKWDGAATEPDEYIGYAEDAGADMYQTEGVVWSFEITKDEVHLEDALYQRFLSQTDILRYIGAV